MVKKPPNKKPSPGSKPWLLTSGQPSLLPRPPALECHLSPAPLRRHGRVPGQGFAPRWVTRLALPRRWHRGSRRRPRLLQREKYFIRFFSWGAVSPSRPVGPRGKPARVSAAGVPWGLEPGLLSEQGLCNPSGCRASGCEALVLPLLLPWKYFEPADQC